MQHPELPVFAFLTAFLVLIPLPWHWRAHNIATVSIITWLFAVDVIYGVNAIIWAGNTNNPAPIWCDIATKVVVGASYALPLAMLCICKHLEVVSSSRKVSFDYSDKRRRIIFESVLCFVVPLVFMVLHYIVQGHRFDIFENTGCQASLYISIPAVMLVWFPQLLFSVITLIYAAMSLHHFLRRRLIFAAHLENSNSALTINRYLRLIAMSVTEMIWGTVFTAFNLYNNVSPGLRPWTTWADVHSNFSRVDLYPTASIPPEFLRRMMLFWWTMPASSIIFFLFFGFGEEAKKEYRKLWMWFRRVVFKRKAQMAPTYKTPSSRSNIRPLHLLPREKQQNVASASPRPSSFTITTPTRTKTEEALTDADTITISTLSYHGQSTDSAHASLSHEHHISLSDAYSSSHTPSPTPSFPVSVHSYTESLPSPIYQRPFNSPTVYPISTPHVRAEDGILVTIHRQASVDNIV